ncbi:ATP-binding protein [Urechidicola croceus]|uniref:AAA family ATPase n=1 Tax=Urechidicola croceus TaxID=1850246 RepID=A0A1D8P8Y9_9FLAO|nr:ATP-binding protein [Urechidicola croceus]AOW21040.1 AAA family ATPase [Urechidicola croceus]
MINKRLLIKNLLSHNDENSFYDKKQELTLSGKVGKAKFIKHICALSNSNPENNSYIVIGVQDETNEIMGVDFYDDSKIQNLVNAYLSNPPKIQYENVGFPKLPKHKVVGLVTIHPTSKIASLKKNAWKYLKGTTFYRRGSNSMPTTEDFQLRNTNKLIVESIEKNASNNIQMTLDGVFDFINNHSSEFNPTYKVFKEQFVLCWAGKKKTVGAKTYYSRVDIALINEQVRLFYSALDEVKIEFNNQSFIITEYVHLGINEKYDYYPLEKTVIHFKDNGKHDIVSELLFQPPEYDRTVLHHIYNSNNTILEKLKSKQPLLLNEQKDLKKFPTTYLICALNGFEKAKSKLQESKNYLRDMEDKTAYIQFKDSMRILRKVKYS